MDIAAKSSGRALNPDLGWIMLDMIGMLFGTKHSLSDSTLVLVWLNREFLYKIAPARVFILFYRYEKPASRNYIHVPI